jgi:hypothetical protein
MKTSERSVLLAEPPGRTASFWSQPEGRLWRLTDPDPSGGLTTAIVNSSYTVEAGVIGSPDHLAGRRGKGHPIDVPPNIVAPAARASPREVLP